MGDSVETKKKINISDHLDDLIKESNDALSKLNSVSGKLLNFYEFAADDYLQGKRFVGDPTLNKMVAAYGEGMVKLQQTLTEMSAVADIRSDNLTEFRQNLDAFIASRNKTHEEIRDMFD